ncbi:MAG: murein hydrolase activator EnvC, partial [Pseudobdellovibrionaceae bacterium]
MKRTLFLLITIFMSFSALAENVSVAELRTAKTTVLRQDYRQRKVMAALYEVNRRMRRVAKDKSKLSSEMIALEPQIEKNAEKISELEVQTVQKKKQIRDRMLATYRMGNQGLLRTLFSVTSAGELDRSMKILSRVSKKDFEMVKEFLAMQELLKKEKENLIAQETLLKTLSSRLQEKETTLLEDQVGKGKLLAQIRIAKGRDLAKLASLRKKTKVTAEDEETREFYELLTRPSFFEQRGFLQPPVAGPLVRGYGYIRDRERSVALAHKGHFYRTVFGNDVQSVFSGKVTFAEAIDGFGTTVI